MMPMKFPSPLLPGVLVKRYRRSLADIRLDEGGVVTTHVFAMGPMTGCSEPGSVVMVSDSNDPARWHPLSWEMIRVGESWVGVNPKISYKIVHEALVEGTLEEIRGYQIHHANVPGKNKGIDFVLEGPEHNCFISLQGVTRVEGGSAFFPETRSEPVRNAIRRLSDVAKRGHRAVAFFHVLRSDCREMKLAPLVDKLYTRAFKAAQRSGVEIIVYRADINPEEVSLGVRIPFSM
jgi:sugar fermentation stimulation protein A